MLRIDVKNSRELQALILSIRRANKEVQGEIRKRTKPMIQTEWQKALAQEALTRTEVRVLVETARVTVSNQNVRLKAGGLAKKLSGGGRARDLVGAVEFGAGQGRWAEYQATSRKGRAYPVRRRATNQFRHWKKNGYVVYPAAAKIIPRLAALWTQTAVRTFLDAIDKKG